MEAEVRAQFLEKGWSTRDNMPGLYSGDTCVTLTPTSEGSVVEISAAQAGVERRFKLETELSCITLVARTPEGQRFGKAACDAPAMQYLVRSLEEMCRFRKLNSSMVKTSDSKKNAHKFAISHLQQA